MKTILLIEDDSEMRENIAEILEVANYHVITAEDGKEGVERALTSATDLIISDISTPTLNGFDTLRDLEKYKTVKEIPVIFLTGRYEKAFRKRSYDLNADVYMSKPLDGNEFLKIVAEKIKSPLIR